MSSSFALCRLSFKVTEIEDREHKGQEGRAKISPVPRSVHEFMEMFYYVDTLVCSAYFMLIDN